jgi:hypothetical protein
MDRPGSLPPAFWDEKRGFLAGYLILQKEKPFFCPEPPTGTAEGVT